MTAIATVPRPATTAGRPVQRRSRAGGRPARGNGRAGAGGMALLVVIAVGVIGVVGVVGSGSGHGAALSGGVADGAAPAAAAAGARPRQVGDEPAGVGAAATVTLGRGETAWEALRPHAPDGTRYEVFVHEVMRANDVDARELRPGDVVVVPGEAR